MRKLMLSLILLFMSACQQPDTAETERPETSLPKQWIYYEGDKYVFYDVLSGEDVDRENITSTHTWTGKGDGVAFGREIFKHEKSGDLLILDDSGPETGWAVFRKTQ
ncbi:MAG: hypothetical protein H0Z33_14415 [Bacillaceae bacterium]|nr:hypothetical protein [Bacillaceae bacterium]